MRTDEPNDNQTDGYECPTCGKVLKTKRGRSIHHARVHDEKLRKTITCAVCGDEFKVRISQAETRIHCSFKCRGETYSERFAGENTNLWKGGKVTLICDYCGDDYDVYPSQEDRSKFCSRGCRADWQSEELTGEDAPHYVGGSYPYGDGWTPKKKQQVRKRDGFECVDCGLTQEEHLKKYRRKLEVHHIRKARDVSDAADRNALENLVTLCRHCHLAKWEKMAPLRPQID
jgi:5-methylcytosine-specific restriction endonuclease McrA